MNEALRKLALDTINRQFLLQHPAQAADVIDGFGKAAAIDLLAEHDADALANVWRHLSPARIDEIVPRLPERLLRQVLHSLDPAVLAVSLPDRAAAHGEPRSRCRATCGA